MSGIWLPVCPFDGVAATMPIIAVPYRSWQPPVVLTRSALIPVFTQMFRKHRPVKIEIDPMAVSSQTPHVSVRLERIAENYRQLDELLANIESRMPVPELSGESMSGQMPAAGPKPFRPQKPR